jgi:hypothetical protein
MTGAQADAIRWSEAIEDDIDMEHCPPDTELVRRRKDLPGQLVFAFMEEADETIKGEDANK